MVKICLFKILRLGMFRVADWKTCSNMEICRIGSVDFLTLQLQVNAILLN